MNNTKVQKEYPDFCKEVDGLVDEALKARIVSLQQALEESESHKAENEALAQAQAELTELKGPYNDVKKAVKMKTKYIIDLLKERA